MPELKIGAILPIFLFFVLIVGVIIIYREEIEKMELFGKLHTTIVPATIISEWVPKVSSPPVSKINSASSAISSSGVAPIFTGNHTIRFGNGRVVDSGVKDITEDLYIGEGSLHSVSSGVGDYHARAFIEEAVRLYESSPYSGSVIFLDRVSNVKESDPRREYFVLLVSNALVEPFSITGWSVSDRWGEGVHKFPEGIKILSTPGEVTDPVIVRAGDAVVVSSGRSPIGSSFRVNKCSGYRSQFEKFVPTVKTSCPDPLSEYLEYGVVPFSDDRCYQAVISLPFCTAMSAIPSGVTAECRDFFNNIMTETGCVSRHRNDDDFFTPEWRLFLGSKKGLWRNRDNVLYLLDRDNLLVATLVYK